MDNISKKSWGGNLIFKNQMKTIITSMTEVTVGIENDDL